MYLGEIKIISLLPAIGVGLSIVTVEPYGINMYLIKDFIVDKPIKLLIMYTLILLSFLIFFISNYRIYKTCKKLGVSFNPMEGTLLEYLGAVFSASTVILVIVRLLLTCLP